jgi:hypothetical protein
MRYGDNLKWEEENILIKTYLSEGLDVSQDAYRCANFLDHLPKISIFYPSFNVTQFSILDPDCKRGFSHHVSWSSCHQNSGDTNSSTFGILWSVTLLRVLALDCSIIAERHAFSLAIFIHKAHHYDEIHFPPCFYTLGGSRIILLGCTPLWCTQWFCFLFAESINKMRKTKRSFGESTAGTSYIITQSL